MYHRRNPLKKEKSFALSAQAAWRGLFCNSQLPFLRELTACLAVYRARVSTWAESGVEREGLKLSVEIFAYRADVAGGLPRNLLQSRTGRAACRRPFEKKTSSL